MAIIPLKITEDGTVGAVATCTPGGDEFANTGVEFIRITNSHATADYTITVTAQTANFYLPRYGKLTKSSVSATVANGNTVFLGPFRPSVFNDANGKAQVTYILGTSGATPISSGHLLKIEVLYLEQK
jgi:hypothetical protein